MRILLTGSNGFIGGHIARWLCECGHRVTGIGRAASPVHAVTRYVRWDLSHPIELDEDVDAVIHAAALASPWARPQAFHAANVEATRNVLGWCRAHGRPHLIYVSSTSVYYRDRDQLGLTETSPIPSDAEQINVYSRTKRIGERLVSDYEGTHLVLRPRAVFGPDDTVLMPRLLRAARAGRLPVFRRADGRQAVADVIYVENVARYVATALEQRVTGSLNITNDRPVEIQPFLADVFRRLGYPVPQRQVPVALAMAIARIAELASATLLDWREPVITRFGVSVFAWSKTFDVALCRSTLGPPHIALEEAVERYVRWCRDHGGA